MADTDADLFLFRDAVSPLLAALFVHKNIEHSDRYTQAATV
jgi:hypothetical protein